MILLDQIHRVCHQKTPSIGPDVQPALFPFPRSHCSTQTHPQRGGDLIGLDESDGEVEGQRMRVAGDPQPLMTGIAGGLHDLPQQVTSYATAAPSRKKS